MLPENAYFGYLALGLPLFALITTLALATRLRFENDYTKEGNALYKGSLAVAAIALFIGGLIALSPFLAFFQVFFLIFALPPVIFTVGQLVKLFQMGVERGRVSFALVAWLSVFVFWASYFEPWFTRF